MLLNNKEDECVCVSEEQLREELAKLPNRLHVAFLAICVEHVYSVCDKIETIDAILDCIWDYVIENTYDESKTAKFSEVLDSELYEDSDTEIVYIAAAAEMVVKHLKNPDVKTVQIINNISGSIDVLDPEPDDGNKEERVWQAQMHAYVKTLDESLLTRNILKEFYTKKMKWMQRYEDEQER